MKDNHMIESVEQNWALSKLSRRTFVKGMGLAAVSTLLPFPRFGTVHAKQLQGSAFVDRWKDGCGLVHNRVSAKWAKICEGLPCFNGVTWPGYAEKVIPHVKITDRDGVVHDAVVHLWKGVCQKFLEPAGSHDFPGGCGAEVGVYLRRDAEWIAKHPLPALTGLAPLNYSYDTNDRWFPAPELGTQLEFRLVDPKTTMLCYCKRIRSQAIGAPNGWSATLTKNGSGHARNSSSKRKRFTRFC